MKGKFGRVRMSKINLLLVCFVFSSTFIIVNSQDNNKTIHDEREINLLKQAEQMQKVLDNFKSINRTQKNKSSNEEVKKLLRLSMQKLQRKYNYQKNTNEPKKQIQTKVLLTKDIKKINSSDLKGINFVTGRRHLTNIRTISGRKVLKSIRYYANLPPKDYLDNSILNNQKQTSQITISQYKLLSKNKKSILYRLNKILINIEKDILNCEAKFGSISHLLISGLYDVCNVSKELKIKINSMIEEGSELDLNNEDIIEAKEKLEELETYYKTDYQTEMNNLRETFIIASKLYHIKQTLVKLGFKLGSNAKDFTINEEVRKKLFNELIVEYNKLLAIAKRSNINKAAIKFFEQVLFSMPYFAIKSDPKEKEEKQNEQNEKLTINPFELLSNFYIAFSDRLNFYDSIFKPIKLGFISKIMLDVLKRISEKERTSTQDINESVQSVLSIDSKDSQCVADKLNCDNTTTSKFSSSSCMWQLNCLKNYINTLATYFKDCNISDETIQQSFTVLTPQEMENCIDRWKNDFPSSEWNELLVFDSQKITFTPKFKFFTDDEKGRILEDSIDDVNRCASGNVSPQVQKIINDFGCLYITYKDVFDSLNRKKEEALNYEQELNKLSAKEIIKTITQEIKHSSSLQQALSFTLSLADDLTTCIKNEILKRCQDIRYLSEEVINDSFKACNIDEKTISAAKIKSDILTNIAYGCMYGYNQAGVRRGLELSKIIPDSDSIDCIVKEIFNQCSKDYSCFTTEVFLKSLDNCKIDDETILKYAIEKINTKKQNYLNEIKNINTTLAKSDNLNKVVAGFLNWIGKCSNFYNERVAKELFKIIKLKHEIFVQTFAIFWNKFALANEINLLNPEFNIENFKTVTDKVIDVAVKNINSRRNIEEAKKDIWKLLFDTNFETKFTECVAQQILKRHCGDIKATDDNVNKSIDYCITDSKFAKCILNKGCGGSIYLDSTKVENSLSYCVKDSVFAECITEQVTAKSGGNVKSITRDILKESIDYCIKDKGIVKNAWEKYTCLIRLHMYTSELIDDLVQLFSPGEEFHQILKRAFNELCLSKLPKNKSELNKYIIDLFEEKGFTEACRAVEIYLMLPKNIDEINTLRKTQNYINRFLKVKTH